jgi:geranylgeranyl diphosphate synthase type II
MEKSTYPAILGLNASRKEAARLTKAAMDALKPLGTKAARLQEIATHLLKREY